MATSYLTTSSTNTIYIREQRDGYNNQKNTPPTKLIDGIFTIPDDIGALTLQDKLSERLN